MKGTNDSNLDQDVRYDTGPMVATEREVARGLRFMHLMVLATERQGIEMARLVEELSKLLIAQGITCDAEWGEALRNQSQKPGDLPL